MQIYLHQTFKVLNYDIFRMKKENDNGEELNMEDNFNAQGTGNNNSNSSNGDNGYSNYSYNYSASEGGFKPYKEKRRSHFKAYISIVLVTTILSSAIVGGTLYKGFSSKIAEQNAEIKKLSSLTTLQQSTSTATSSTGASSASNTSSGYTVADIAKKVGPSVVGIRMTVTNSSQNNIYQFFGGNSDAVSEGSGIIISKDGYIMTNYHVVEYADPKNSSYTGTILEAFLSDGKQAKAKFIGGDSENDIAVIKVDLTGLTAAELGDSSKLLVGEQVVAIGNPLGMDFAGSVTTGIVSALNREVQTDGKVLNLIQTDAAINAGNSGGALLNPSGQVIGINTAKISETGVGFAIPINDAKPIAEELIAYGYVKGRPMIGIQGQDVTDVISQQYNLPVGVYVYSVVSGSGADKAGIKRGDIIVSMAGKEVKTMSELNSVKKNYKAGDTVDVVASRNGSKLNLKLTFSEDR